MRLFESPDILSVATKYGSVELRWLDDNAYPWGFYEGELIAGPVSERHDELWRHFDQLPEHFQRSEFDICGRVWIEEYGFIYQDDDESYDAVVSWWGNVPPTPQQWKVLLSNYGLNSKRVLVDENNPMLLTDMILAGDSNPMPLQYWFNTYVKGRAKPKQPSPEEMAAAHTDFNAKPIPKGSAWKGANRIPAGMTKAQFNAQRIGEAVSFLSLFESQIRIKETNPGLYKAYVNRRLAGALSLHHKSWSDKGRMVHEVVVNPGFRRQGIATALYRYVEEDIGEELIPSDTLSDEGFKFWVNYRDGAIDKKDVRRIQDQLVGQKVTSPKHDNAVGKIKGIRGVGDRAAISIKFDEPIDNRGSTISMVRAHELRGQIPELDKFIAESILFENYDAAEDFYDRQDRVADRIISDFLANPESTIKVPKVPAARTKKIWQDYAKTHVVRDEKGLNTVVNTLLDGICALYVSTQLCGHTDDGLGYQDVFTRVMGWEEDEVDDRLKAIGAWDDKWDEPIPLYDYLTIDGEDFFSDYGLRPLVDIAIKLEGEFEPEKMLFLCDRAFNVVHQRNDLSSFFIEGGVHTLDAIFDHEEDDPASARIGKQMI